MKAAARAVVPPPIFKAVTMGPVIDTTTKSDEMDALCSQLKGLQQITHQERRGNGFLGGTMLPVSSRVSMDYFINPQYVLQSFVTQAVARFSLLKVVLDANYLIERHLDDLFIYRLTIDYFDPTTVKIAPVGASVLFSDPFVKAGTF